MFKSFIDAVRESFGRPVTLIRLLHESPNIRVSLDDTTPCIAVDSVVAWHELGTSFISEPGSLMGWRQSDGGSYESFLLQRFEFAQIGERKITDSWECDITDVHGFSASKSNLHSFASTDQMVEANSKRMIDVITHEKLAINLDHKEIRIIHSPGKDSFCLHSWDGRVFLMNSGGSHHFAAAKYIAARLAVSVALRGTLCTYSISADAVASLRRDFEMFVISDEPAISNAFHNAMERFRATWLWHPAPRGLGCARIILLPKNEHRSMRVATLIREAGVSDLGEHLARLASNH
jgi:hypothetical protein